MTKPKTLEQLRAEKERAETQLAQEQHMQRSRHCVLEIRSSRKRWIWMYRWRN